MMLVTYSTIPWRRFLAEHWDHEDFILNLTYTRNAFCVPYAQCTNFLVVHQGLQLQLDHHYIRFNTPPPKKNTSKWWNKEGSNLTDLPVFFIHHSQKTTTVTDTKEQWNPLINYQ